MMPLSNYHTIVDDLDDNSSLDSAEMLELEQFQDGDSFASDLEDEHSDDSSASEDDISGFLLDMSLLERDGLLRREPESRRRGRRTLENEDPLETDSLKLIRKRVSEEVDRLPVKAPEPVVRSSPIPVVKKLEGSLPFHVCEVPLGVSLKDIIPSSLFRKQNFRDFEFPVSQPMSSASLLDGIDKALDIVSSPFPECESSMRVSRVA